MNYHKPPSRPGHRWMAGPQKRPCSEHPPPHSSLLHSEVTFIWALRIISPFYLYSFTIYASTAKSQFCFACFFSGVILEQDCGELNHFTETLFIILLFPLLIKMFLYPHSHFTLPPTKTAYPSTLSPSLYYP